MLAADESTVQDARSKAAAAGVPSSEPMTLQELEAVQQKMTAKLKQPNAFTSGEHFLDVARSSTQPTSDHAVPGQPALPVMMINQESHTCCLGCGVCLRLVANIEQIAG